MSVYMITYFLSDTAGCGCGHDHSHDHDHDDSCDCGHDHTHEHEHNDSCGCGDDHAHEEAVNAEPQIIAKIKSLGAWARYMPEGFFVKTESLSANEIFEEINSVANPGDIIFVTKIESATSACANPAVLDWLKDC